MKRIWVTLESPFDKENVDLEVPGDKPIDEILPDVIRALNWPETRGRQTLHYTIATQDGQPIDPQETLSSAGVKQQAILKVLIDTRPPGTSWGRAVVQQPHAETVETGRQPDTPKKPPQSDKPSRIPKAWRQLDDSDLK